MTDTKITRAGWAVAEIMSTRTALPLPDLMAELRARRLAVTPDQFDEVWHSEVLALTAKVEIVEPELIVNLPRLLAGRVFTHRLDQVEIDRDLLLLLPDFAGAWPLLDTAPFDLIDGEQVVEDYDDDLAQAVLRVGPGQLDRFAPGDLVALTVTATGLQLGVAEEPDPADLAEIGAILAADVQEFLPAPQPLALEEFITLVLSRHESLFTTAGRPLGELIDHLGLDHDHGSIAGKGFDFAAEAQLRSVLDEIEMLCETYDLEEDQATAVAAFSAAASSMHDTVQEWIADQEETDDVLAPPEAPLEMLIPLLIELADPMVPVAISEENLYQDDHLVMVMTQLLASLREFVPRRALAGFSWLRGRTADLLGDLAAAQESYELALDLDPDHYPAMRELAALASLRGDARGALSLLTRAGVPTDDPEVAMLTPFAGESRTDIGRNQDCWCGSGRKYKKCHLGRSDHDLLARWEWLYKKASQWVRNSAGRNLLVELAEVRAGAGAQPDEIADATGDPLVMDVALFEGGLLQEFLTGRGHLLPADERALAASWSTTDRSLYRVEQLDPDGQAQLTDLLGGDPGEAPVAVRLPAATVVGALYCLHLLPLEGPTGSTRVVAPGVQPIPGPAAELTRAMLVLQRDDEVDPERLVAVLTDAARG